MSDAPKVIWLSSPATSEEYGVRISDPTAHRKLFPVHAYIRADAPELVALVETLRMAGTACVHGNGESWGMRLSQSPLGREIVARMDAANAALAKWEALQ